MSVRPQALLGTPLRDGWFAVLLVVCSLLSFVVLQLRFAQKRRVSWPFDEVGWRGVLSSIVLVPWLFLAVLAPKFYWQTFTGDGIDGFEAARLLFVQPVPFWDRAVGLIWTFPVTSVLFVYPISWFMRLFGEIEISARLPMVLYLIAIYAAVVGLAQYGRLRLKVVEHWLIWLALAIYLVVMTFSNTYNTYYADLANPASLDTLAVACFLGFVFAFVRNEPFWIVSLGRADLPFTGGRRFARDSLAGGRRRSVASSPPNRHRRNFVCSDWRGGRGAGGPGGSRGLQSASSWRWARPGSITEPVHGTSTGRVG